MKIISGLKMDRVKRVIDFLIQSKIGYKLKDKLLIILSSLDYFLTYLINSFFYMLFSHRIIYPHIFSPRIIVKTQDGLYECRRMEFYMMSENFEKAVRNYIKSFKKGVFVDVGAFIGKYTIMVSNKINGKVISIEPNPSNFERLKKNIELNKAKNILPIKVACWNKREIRKIYHHDNDPALFSLTRVSKSYSYVKCDSLDNILYKLGISDVDLVKIDAEGSESKILEGMKKLLKVGKVKIIFEAWTLDYLNSCKKILSVYNYKLKPLDYRHWLAFR